MTAETHASSDGNGCNNTSSSPAVDPAKSAMTHDAAKLLSSDCNGNGMIFHGSPAAATGRNDGDDNFASVTSNHVDSSVPLDDNEDPNESPRESPVGLRFPNGKLAATPTDHDSHDKPDAVDALSQDSLSKPDYGTDDLPSSTQIIHQNGTAGEIGSEPHLASGQDHQDSQVVASLLESAVNGLDSPEPNLVSSLDANVSESTNDNHEPQEGILISSSGKSSEPDVCKPIPADDTDDLPIAIHVTHQNEIVEDSALHQLVILDIDSKLSPPDQDNQDSEVADSILESTVNRVDSSEPVSLVVLKSSDAYHEPQEDNSVSIIIRSSEADVNKSTFNPMNDDTDDLPAVTKVIHKNGTVDDSAPHQFVHHGIDRKRSPAPGQDDQEFEVTTSILKSEVDLVHGPEPDLAVSLDVTKSSNVSHEPQEDNLVSVSSKSSEADVSQSTSTNQQNLKSFGKVLEPQDAFSDATHTNSQLAEVQINKEQVTPLEGRLVLLEQLEFSQFDETERRIEEETKTELLSEVEENQPTIVEIDENGLSNLDQKSEAEQTIYEVDFTSTTSAAVTALNHKKDHLAVLSSHDCIQDTKQFNEFPDENEKSLALDESLSHSDPLSPAPVCLSEETDTVGKTIESVQNFLQSNEEKKFHHEASSLTYENDKGIRDPEIEDLVNVSVQSLVKLPDIPGEPEASTPAESCVVDTDQVIDPETDIASAISANPEGSISFPVSNEKSEIMFSDDVSGNDLGKSIDMCTTDSTTTRNEFELGLADSGEKVPSCQVDAHDTSKIGILDVEVKPEVEDMNSSGMDSEDLLCNSALASKFEVSGSSLVTVENVPNSIPEVKNVEEEGDQLPVSDAQSNDKLTEQEGGNMEKSQSNEPSVPLLEGSTTDALARPDVAVGLLTRPFQFLIRIPRFDDLKVREQIKHAQLQVDEKTKIRDAFRLEIQKLKANCHGHAAEYEAAVSKARSSKRSVKSKRAEIDSLQVVINKVKNAISIDDIDARIYSMEHMIQHETLPLKEEKQFIREIKQLKQLREQLSSNIGSQDEVQQALNEREEIEEKLKILKKELDNLKEDVLKAETVARAAQKKYEDENRKLKEHISQFEEANDIRQSAYHHLQSLRKELFDKNKLFRSYKDIAAAASDLAASRDRESLHHLCHNQVETIMDLWNKDHDFRKEYEQYNARSTVRRLRTLDGRSLGPDEEPPMLASFGVERQDRFNSNESNTGPVVQTPILKQVNETKSAKDDSDKVKEEEAKKQAGKYGGDLGKHRLGKDEMSEKEYIPTKEELELARKADELRKEEYAAKLREERRLEEKSKALEALERKKRNAEKAQQRAELRAQKEAEQKEKEREKRLRKKERKKASESEIGEGNNMGGSNPGSEMMLTEAAAAKEAEGKESLGSAPKRAVKPSLVSKQSKAKSGIPPPLRNRSKRKMQQWMWVTITCIFVIFLFVLGNVGFFSNLSNLRPRKNNSL